MDLMARRRLLFQTQSGPLDTSPKIMLYGHQCPQGNPANQGYPEAAGSCVTEIYRYTKSSAKQTLVHYGGYRTSVLYLGNTYKDWYGTQSLYSIIEREILNANTDGIQMALAEAMLDVCFAYVKDTGQILFAGKDSIYYGHKNISELN